MDHLPKNLIWSVVKNATSQVGGRLFLTLARFGVAVLIVRYCGVDRFGEYSLILSLLLVTEWIADFGLTDIIVRAMCRDPQRQRSLLSALAAAKGVQVMIALGFLLGALVVMQYPANIVRAGAIVGIEVFFYGGALVYRALFRARMVMERDVGAEIAGVLVMIPLIWYACVKDASLEVLAACYLLSRVVFFVVAFAAGRRDCSPNPFRASLGDLKWAFKAALPLGVAGLLVCFYDVMDPILLSRMDNIRSVGYFSSAMRFTWPVVIAVQAICATVFPLLSSYWNRQTGDFRRTLQGVVNVAVLLGAGTFCIFNSCPESIMGLLGPEMVEAAFILRLLSWVVFFRAITSVVAPLIIITGRTKHALWLVAIAVSTKAALLTLLIPRYGVAGAAVGYIISEIVASMIPAVLFTQYLIGYWINWSIVVKAAAAVAIALGVCYLTNTMGSPLGGLIASVVFLAAAVSFKAVSFAEMKRVVQGVRERFGPFEDRPE